VCLEKLPDTNEINDISRMYVERLENLVRSAPYAWQGFDYAF